ncbi:MAG: hypothetical protein J0L60_09290 [Ignavibacteria bacterium]|nr:hypothetical protein [Ignavibacteria bacterium]MCA0390102.1 hypothetical protein [Bacteroidota bacterium]
MESALSKNQHLTHQMFDFNNAAEKLAKFQDASINADRIKKAFNHAHNVKENAEYLLKLLYEKELLESILSGKNRFCIHVAGHNIDVHFKDGLTEEHLFIIKDMLKVIETHLKTEVEEFVDAAESE